MSSTVRTIIDSFASLTPDEQYEALAEMMRRSTSMERDSLQDEELAELAAVTFQELDRRELLDEQTNPR